MNETAAEFVRRLHRLVASHTLAPEEIPLVRAVGLQTGKSAGPDFRARQQAAIEHVARELRRKRQAANP